MSNTMSLGAETGLTVLDSKADINAEARSCEDTGVVTCELILLSRHHLTKSDSQQTVAGYIYLLTIEPRH